MVKRFAPIGAAIFFLQACSSLETTLPTQADFAKFEAGGSAILITNVAGDLQCDNVIFGINRKGAETNSIMTTIYDPGYASTKPAMIVVPPGRYEFNRGSCDRSGYYPEDLPNLLLWFDGVDVKAGDVAYLGTLDIGRVDVQEQAEGFERLIRLFDDTPTLKSTYISYEIKDMSAEVLERLNVTHPALATKMKTIMPYQIISRDDFKQAIVTSYAPGPDGQAPLRSTIDTRLDQELNLLVTKTDERLKAHQQSERTSSPTD